MPMKNGKRKGEYSVVKVLMPNALHALAKSEAALEQIELRELYRRAVEAYVRDRTKRAS
jgi:hypothetical protein